MSQGVAAQSLPSIPVTVIGGYLGAGKTTLVNHLLRHANGRRIAVMVNDFGALPIDRDLIEAQDGNVLAIAGGCVCCSYGSDLIEALMEMAGRTPRPDAMIIETSGVALPGPVASSVTLVAGYAVDGIVVLADAETVRERGADRYLADTIDRQLADANLVVLNKVDLVDEPALAETRAWIATKAPHARLIETTQSVLPVEVVIGADATCDPALGAAASRQGEATCDPACGAAASRHKGGALGYEAPTGFRLERHAMANYVTRSFEMPHRVDVPALAAALADPALALLRAKGFVTGEDGMVYALQAVGSRVNVSPAPAAAGNAGIVVIGLRSSVDLSRIERIVGAVSKPSASKTATEGSESAIPPRG